MSGTATDVGAGRRPRLLSRSRPVADRQSVTTLELYFDLVFVFALTQVTAAMAADLTATGAVRGLLVVALLWWSWTGYAWLGNLVRADEGPVRLALFASMAAMFVLALSIPEAFGDLPGGLSGPVVVAICYAAFRVLHLVLYFALAADDHGLRRQLMRFAPSVVGSTALLLAAAAVDGPARTWLWVAALGVDYVGSFLAGASGWRVRSAKHFTERHGLIVIVALGESIVAIGVGVAQLPISWPIILASVLGLTVAACLWWTYFDVTSLAGEHALATAPASERPWMARDAYTFLHLPLVAGVVLLALGLKKVLEHVGDPEHHALDDPLPGVALVALAGGTALYLLALVAFARRTAQPLPRARLVGAGLLVILVLLGGALPALAVLVAVTSVLVALVVFEVVHDREVRQHARGDHEHAATAR